MKEGMLQAVLFLWRQSDVKMAAVLELQPLGRVQAAGFRRALDGVHNADRQILPVLPELCQEPLREGFQRDLQVFQGPVCLVHPVFRRKNIVPGRAGSGLLEKQHRNAVLRPHLPGKGLTGCLSLHIREIPGIIGLQTAVLGHRRKRLVIPAQNPPGRLLGAVSRNIERSVRADAARSHQVNFRQQYAAAQNPPREGIEPQRQPCCVIPAGNEAPDFRQKSHHLFSLFQR